MHSFRSARNKYSKIMDINEYGFLHACVVGTKSMLYKKKVVSLFT